LNILLSNKKTIAVFLTYFSYFNCAIISIVDVFWANCDNNNCGVLTLNVYV